MSDLVKINRWKKVPLAEVVDILDSKRIPVNSRERAERIGDVPYYGATGQVGFINAHLFDEELVLLGEDGAPFLDPAKPTAYMIHGKSWVNNHAHVLRGKPGLLNSFLLYQLNNLDYRPYVSGTTRLKLPQGQMRRIPLLLPSEDEQRRIVAEIEKQFTRLDAGVAALQRVQTKLKRYRASVLKSACEGRLVPTEAELARAEGRDYEPAKVLLQRILTERREKWNGRGKYKEPAAPDIAELPELPEGWIWANFDALITSGPQNGVYLPRERYGTGHPILRIDDYQIGWVRDITDLNIVDADSATIETYSLQLNDLVINRVNSLTHLGKCLLVRNDIASALFESNMMRIVLSENIKARYVEIYLHSQEGRGRLISHAKWAVNQASINQQDVKRTPIPLPSLAEQERIVAEVERRISVMDELEATVKANLQRATRLRQSILQQAFNGEL